MPELLELELQTDVSLIFDVLLIFEEDPCYIDLAYLKVACEWKPGQPQVSSTFFLFLCVCEGWE